MTTGGSGNDPKNGPGFGDELLAELDAWDKTFDALHDQESLFSPAAAAPAAPVVPPPAPAPPAFDAGDDDVTRTVALAPPSAAAQRAAEAAALDEPTGVGGAPEPPPAFDEPTGVRAPSASASTVFDEPTVMTTAPLPPAAPPVVVVPPPRRSAARTTPPPAPRSRVVAVPPVAVPPPPVAARPVSPPRPSTAVDETDFSDLGFSGPPEALGSLLGQPPPLPPLEEVSPDVALASFDDDEVLTSAVRPDAAMAGLAPTPVDDDPFAPSADDLDELQRMAQRQGGEMTRVAQVPAELFEVDETMDRGVAKAPPEDFSDPAADPADDTFDRANRTRILDPNDALLAEAGAKKPVRTPAIVRRGAESARKKPASTGGFGGGESTRVADLRELEKLRSHPEAPRQARPTPATAYQPPPEPEEDFYADIEIGGDEEEVTGTPASAKRVTANVVRRTGDSPALRPPPAAPTRPAPARPIADDDDEPELQISAAEPEPAAPVAKPPVDDDLGLDAAMAEFMTPEVTPVGARVDAAPPPAPAIEDAIPDAVPEPVAESGAFAGGPVADVAADPLGDMLATIDAEPAAPEVVAEAGFEAAPELALELEPAPSVEIEAAPEPAVELEAAPELAVELEAAPELAVEADAAVEAAPVMASGPATQLGVAPFAAIASASPAVAPSSAAAFADDAGSQTKIGVPPPPRPTADRSGPVEAPAARPATAPPTRAPTAPPIAAAPPVVADVALPPALFAATLPTLELDAVRLPEHVDPTAGFDLGEAAAHGILRLEQELELIDEPRAQAVLRIEAGRLYERLGDVDRARASYDAALLADPRATAALRGLRRIARGAGDVAEATTHLDAELGIAGPLERRALALHRVDLLMAASEQDLARVAVGELIDEAKSDVRAQLAQLELAFLDGRADELDEALERLGAVLADGGLRAAVDVARGHLRDRSGDRAGAAASFARAIGADGAALAAHVGLLRDSDGGDAAAALAARVPAGATQAALLLEAAQRGHADSLAAAAALAPDDPTVQAAYLAAAMAGGAPTDEAIAMAARASDPALLRAASLWAAARVAADPARAAQAVGLYQAVLGCEPADELATAALVDARLAAGDPAGAAEQLILRLAAEAGDELDRVRAATLFAAAGQLDRALPLVPAAEAVDSPAAADAWADVLGAGGQVDRRGELLAAIAARSDERVDARTWARKAATALDRAARPDEPATMLRALEAWGQVAELGADAELAHPRAMVLAAATGDAALIATHWGRAQAAAESPAAAATIALARARIAAGDGAPWAAQDELLHEVPATDPRRLAATAALAGTAGLWTDVVLAYEDRAGALPTGSPEALILRYRAAGLALDRANDGARASTLLATIADEQPGLGFVHDALATARRRLGDAAPPPRATRVDGNRADGFARLVRDAEQLAEQGDGLGALALLTKALELRPHDPLAGEPLVRVAAAVREAGPITAAALAELRMAEDAGDHRGAADAYEALARVDAGLRDDRASALMSIEAAAAADPARLALVRELERAYAAAGRWADLVALRERQLAGEPVGADRVALAADRALLLERLDRPEDELRAAYQEILAQAPRTRRALFQLESLVRRGGSSPELAALEDAIAAYFESDPRTRSAFLTRGGETLSDLGKIDDAIAHFREANELRGGYPAALEGWRDAALRGQLWADLADAAGKEAALTDPHSAEGAATRARLWHLAGVALMDRALASERAIDAFRATLAADPQHTDAFVRLRLLLDEQGEHEALAQLLEDRLTVETDSVERVALHRAIAELARNFLEDRDRAKYHYRAIVDRAPSDLRAIAALSDIAWEQGAWGEAADALLARARLERDPGMQRNIHFRLGMIYADRLPDPPAAIRAFQRVLAHDPDDEAALERLADLGIATAEWRMALGACERLVKNETVPARKVAHLHRVGRIFAEGFADRRKAERAYQLAVDAAPDSDVALAALIKFYEAAGDAASIRVHLGMVAAAMRQRIAGNLEGSAFRVLARVARARHDAGVPGQAAVHKNAVDVARLLGADAEQGPATAPVAIAGLMRPEADELLWPAAVSSGLRQMMTLLGDRLAKHVGIDLRPYGVTRGDRLRAKDSPVAAAAQEVAEGLGLGEIDVYVSTKQPYAMVAEPTSPLSLVIGSAIADGNRLAAVRFAATGALRLATAHLSILARLPEEELGVLVVALLRLFQPDLPYLAVDNEQVGLQIQRLRRLIPSGLSSELRPYALSIDGHAFDHRELHRGLETAAHRAGLVAAGGAAAPIALLLARTGAADLAAGGRDPAVTALVQYAVSEDFAALAAICQG
ncbi:MAG: hypothetical protein KA201_14895 [Kofleriaceae bacterium]|nr:hypothetical protein [Kofleriaceae bacterium]